MQSQSPSDMTRWGTSVQLTGAGVSAVSRFNAAGDPTRVRNAGEKRRVLVMASKVCILPESKDGRLNRSVI
jgi:hypothetical protein